MFIFRLVFVLSWSSPILNVWIIKYCLLYQENNFLWKLFNETSINIKFLCAFQNLRQMTNLIKRLSIIVGFYSSRNFIFYKGLIMSPIGYSTAKTKEWVQWNKKRKMTILSILIPNFVDQFQWLLGSFTEIFSFFYYFL